MQTLNENHTHSSHLFQCPSEKPCTEEKRFPNKILDPSQLLSSTLNITQVKGALSWGKERSYIFSLLNPLLGNLVVISTLLLCEPAYGMPCKDEKGLINKKEADIRI